ncbi:zinc finger protein 676-like [Maniola hyperantus]|uniref:zinc finger protein 676-like n=1 Tax=Aphantopus hyperantus TaxID=2795564 RepID=UPI001569F791|nr:zinc finger protein 676-like [Maniola hyperantus]
MASHTRPNIEILSQHFITEKQKVTTYRNVEPHKIVLDQGKKLRIVEKESDLANKDLESLITHHNIDNDRNLPDKQSYRKVERKTQALAAKATTIELVGGIFCQTCKLSYSNKKEFDVHYARHFIGEAVYACVVCYKEFKSYPSFRGHCYTTHVIKERHKCESCNKTFSKFAALKDHIKIMHVFKCSTCSKQFSSKNELLLHQTIHNTSNAPPYHCQICEEKIDTLDSCKTHADIHTVNIYTCPICNENIPSRDNAADHLIKHFDNVKDEPEIKLEVNCDNPETAVEYLGGIACRYCSVVSKNRFEFDAHFSHEHGDEDIVYICVVCDKSFEKYSVFAKHAYNHRAKHRFCCSICLKPFNRLSLLSAHMAACKADAAASGKPFACSECERRYVTEGGLRKHLLDAHGQHCLTCPVEHCQKTFSSPKELVLHQQIHSSHQNWCRQCGLSFPTLLSCSQHLEAHKRKLFGCPVCNKTYHERHMLLNHLAQHFTSVLHICKVCGKVYNNRRNFMEHLKTHSEKKIHSCSYCGKGFPKVERLQEHLNIHTGSKPYKCTVCSRTFASYPNWSTHKRRMHNVEEKIYSKNPTSDNDKTEYSEEEFNQNDINYSNSHSSEHDESLAKINDTDIKLDYVCQVQDDGMETQTTNSVNEVQEPQTIDHIDQIQDNNMEAESIIHIDIEKELQILESLPENQNNGNVELVDVLATHDTIFDNAGTEVPPNTVSSEANNFPPEYGPEFILGDNYGFLDLDDHMLPHIDPLLTIKTEEFNRNNLPLLDLDAGMYQVAPKWEPPIFTKVCPEYPYGYGDMVDSNRLSMMNTDIF